LDDEKNAFSPSSLSANTEHQLLSAVLEEHHVDSPLYTPEGALSSRKAAATGLRPTKTPLAACTFGAWRALS
jgi:hypothetical protein